MEIKESVKEKYAEGARRVSAGEGLPADCCAATGCCSGSAAAACDPITSKLYDDRQMAELPDTAMKASLGCGNPTALAQINPGEVVLDLGSGGGIDVILSAMRVGPKGRAYGLDMTDDMLALARDNQRKAGIENAEFLKGEIEDIPLPGNMVDVVISNCVINLSGDKDRVLAEAFRVLKPGGRFAVSDVVVRGEVPAQVKKSMELWVGCIAGALQENEYRAKLAQAGFDAITFEVTRTYGIDDARAFLTAEGIDVDEIAPLLQDKFVSAFIRANKPAELCCGGDCPCHKQ
jgi:arsenite methyltransferase